MKRQIDFQLNGNFVLVNVDPMDSLLTTLRENLKMTGTKQGCEVGECGACTVILDREAVTSCIVPMGQVQGREVITIEGLEKNGQLDGIQQAFIDEHAVQCGFCTPGMIMSAKALLMRTPHPTDEDILAALEGNICRCTGYVNIANAVKKCVTKDECL